MNDENRKMHFKRSKEQKNKGEIKKVLINTDEKVDSTKKITTVKYRRRCKRETEIVDDMFEMHATK